MEISKKQLILLTVVVVAFVGVSDANNDYKPVKETPKCVIQTDFSTTATTLRSLIFQGKTKEAAKVLASNETFGLGTGLTYLPEQLCAVVRTKNRRSDPDIVAIQAIALSAKSTGETLKLANAIVLSFELECRCSLFTSEEKDTLVGAWRGILEDPKEIQRILEFGRTPVFSPSSFDFPFGFDSVDATIFSTTESSGSHGRRLRATESSPTDSFVCAYCDPARPCRVNNWCRSS